jgi:hypothetical protein
MHAGVHVGGAGMTTNTNRGGSGRPTLLTPNSDGIPATLKERDQWVPWRARRKPNGKLDKIPVNPTPTRCDNERCCKPGSNDLKFHDASVSDSTTWGTFETVLSLYERAGFAGISHVLTEDEGIVGIDIDGCREPKTGTVEPWAQAIVDELGTYTEPSPSGTGLRLWAFGTLPPTGRKKGAIEMYTTGRHLTVTGRPLPGHTEIRNCNGALTTLHHQIFGDAKPKETTPRPVPTLSLEDAEVLDRARGGANGSRFAALFDRGDWQGQGYESQSAADLALCNDLRFWTGADPHQMDRLFRQGGLYRPKWDEQRGELTYGQRTITLALTGPVYSPSATVTFPTPDPTTAASGRGPADARDEIIAVQAARIAELEATVARQHRVITGAVAVLEADMKPEAKVVQMGIAFRQHHGFGVRRPETDDAAAELTAFYVHQPSEAERLHISTDAIQDVMNVATEQGAAFVKRDRTLSASPFTGEVLDQPHKFVAYVPAHDDLGETLHAIAGTVPDELKKKRRQCRPRPEPTSSPLRPPTPPICDCGGDTDRRTERADVARCMSCNTATQAVLLRDGAVLRPITATSGRGVSPPLSHTVVNGSSTDARSGRGAGRCPECRAPLKPDGICGWAAAHAEAVPS